MWRDDTLHQTTVERTQSKRSKLLRTGANSIEKAASVQSGRGQSDRFFAVIGYRKPVQPRLLSGASSIPESGIEPVPVA
jgi:hypothetical protein